MHSFQVVRPRSLAEALDILRQRQPTWRTIAGGTDLLVDLRNSQEAGLGLEGLVDISSLEELSILETTDTQFIVGAMVTFADLCRSPLVSSEVPLLVGMARQMGSPQIRNRATIGGNLVNAATAADSIPPLLALSAHLTLSSSSGTRVLRLDEFIQGPRRTAIRPDEILTYISFARLPVDTAWGYTKLGRRKSAAISRVSVAAIRPGPQTNEGEGRTCRLAAGAVTPRPMRLRSAEQCLARDGWSQENILRAAAFAREEVASITGNRWSSAYKLPVLENLVRRTLDVLNQ